MLVTIDDFGEVTLNAFYLDDLCNVQCMKVTRLLRRIQVSVGRKSCEHGGVWLRFAIGNSV